MNLDELRKALGTGSPGEQLEVVRYLEPSCQSEQQAYAYLWAIVASLLRAGRLVAAAALLWGVELFNSKPESVKRIFRAIEAEDHDVEGLLRLLDRANDRVHRKKGLHPDAWLWSQGSAPSGDRVRWLRRARLAQRSG